MLTTVAKKVQSRLSRKGVKVVLGDVKTQCELMISNIENPTEVELLAVQEHFMSNATQLTVISDNVPTEQTELEETLTSEDVDTVNSVDNINTASIQDIDNQEETAIAPNQETSICVGDENGNIQPTITEQMETLPQSSELTHTTQSQLITTTADQMGIVLDASEISLIAENINDSTDTLEQDIDAIRSAIIAFVEHKALVNQSKINEMINEVRQVVGEKNTENSQLLSDGLKSINNDIQEANKQFKSNVKKALSAFTIPAIKAG